MKVIISSYSFYPLDSGGTEIYSLELYNYLKLRGDEIIFFVSSNFSNLNERGFITHTLYRDKNIHTFTYQYENITIIGVDIIKQSLHDQYSRYNSNWEHAFTLSLKLLDWINIDCLYMQGVSGISGLALYNSLVKHNDKLSRIVWVHTPFMCPKGNLILPEKGVCNKDPNLSNCSSCIYATSLNSKFFLGEMIYKSIKFISKRTDDFGIKALQIPTLVAGHFNSLLFLLNSMNKIICFSEQIAEVLEKMKIDSEKVVINSHGIDLALYHNVFSPKIEGPKKFLFNGRWDPVKGYKTLIKSWKRLEVNPEERILIICSDLTSAQYQEYGEFFNRPDVQIISSMNKIEMINFYVTIDCVLIPSEWVETGPLVFHEAIAANCYVIASNIGGNLGLHSKYNSNSKLFEVGNFDSLLKAIIGFERGNRPLLKVKSIKEHFDEIF